MSTTPSLRHGRLLEVSCAKRPSDARLEASPSKSVTHRAVLMGLLVPHLRIEDPLLAADTLASLRLAHALGATSSLQASTPAGKRLLSSLPHGNTRVQAGDPSVDGSSWEGVALQDVLRPDDVAVPSSLLAVSGVLRVEGPDAGEASARALPVLHDEVDVGNSGTTLRLGAALAALGSKPVTLTGDESLLTRPMGLLVGALKDLGAKCQALGPDGRPPVCVEGPLAGGEAVLDGGVSSQYISALLLAAHGSQQSFVVRVKGRPASVPYIRLTMDLLASLGGHVAHESGDDETVYRVPGEARLSSGTVKVPGDWSSAAFPLVAAAVTGGRVRLGGLDPQSPQGDRVVLEALRAAGCAVEWRDEDGGNVLEVAGPQVLRPFEMDLNATPDLLPPLGVLAARADGTSRFTGIAHARLKETDRIAATAAGLEALGFQAREDESGLEVTGDPHRAVSSAVVETHGDHRILMSFAVLALTRGGPVRLTHPGCYHVSYPRFRLDLDRLGGASSVVSRQGAPAAGSSRSRGAPGGEDAG